MEAVTPPPLGVALVRLNEATEVEAAYRTQAILACDRYNTATGIDPHSSEAERAWKLRKEAMGQWLKARADLDAAKRTWKLEHGLSVARRRAGL